MSLVSQKRFAVKAGLAPAVFIGIVTIAPAAGLVAGATQTETLTIPGVRVGDAVFVQGALNTPSDLNIVRAGVSAADTVQLAYRNMNAGTQSFSNFDTVIWIMRG